ncbi:MAG: hypothetical protein ABI398_06850 [Devosia sp.]
MSLNQSHAIHLGLRRPFGEVYAFLSRPQNYAAWAAVTGAMQQIGPRDWRADTALGDRIVRFCAPNSLGVLDHAVFREGESPVMLPMWLVADGEGCDLVFVFFRRPEMTDEQFVSAIEWINTDFLTLRSLLEV